MSKNNFQEEDFEDWEEKDIEDENFFDCPNCGCKMYDNEKLCPKCKINIDDFDDYGEV